jgi:predicted permease
MSFLKQDVSYAVRQVRKSPGFTIAAVVTLAFGIGANTAFFGVINATLFRPLPYPEPNRLVYMSEQTTKSGGLMPVSYPDYVDWKLRQTSFSALTIYRTGTSVNLKTNSGIERMSTVMVDHDFLNVLGFHPALGRDLTADDDRSGSLLVVLLTNSAWTSHFNADPRVVGQAVDVDGKSATIVGVLPAAFSFFADAELVMPLGPFVEEMYMQARASHSNARVLGRLKPGVALLSATSEMNAIASHLAEQYPKSNSGIGVALADLHQQLTGVARQRQLLLMGAVGMVLLIVCVNIATLYLSRLCAREREMAIRAALGADRPRLVRQVIVESLLLAAVGGAAGLSLAFALSIALRSLVPVQLLQLNAGSAPLMDFRVLAFTLAVTLLTGLGFGMVPAWLLSRTNPNRLLKDRSASDVSVRGRFKALDLLVIVQVGSAALLLITAGLVLRSLWTLTSRPLGYDPENLLSLRLASPGPRMGGSLLRIGAFYQDAADRLAELPGVQSATVTSNLAFGFNDSHNQFRPLDRPAPSPNDYPSSSERIVSADYFRTMGIPLLQGRVFNGEEQTPSLPSAAPSMNEAIAALRGLPIDIVVTRSFAQHYWPNQNPVGKQILLGPPDIGIAHCTVIGVVGDTTQDSLSQTNHEEFYISLRQFPFFPEYSLVVRTRQTPSSLIQSVRSQMLQMTTTELAYDVRPLDIRIAASISGQSFQSKLIGSFAALALVLAFFGLYGVLAFNVGRRTREIGIRMALGAPRKSVVGNVFFRGFTMVVPSLVIGSAGAWMLGRYLQNQLFEISANDPRTYAAALLTMLLAAFFACWLPARRAATVDPLVALRDE